MRPELFEVLVIDILFLISDIFFAVVQLPTIYYRQLEVNGRNLQFFWYSHLSDSRIMTPKTTFGWQVSPVISNYVPTIMCLQLGTKKLMTLKKSLKLFNLVRHRNVDSVEEAI